MKTAEKTRFDARLTREQKELFERAAHLTGARSLTDFVISSAQREADKIIRRNQFVFATSEKDQQIFFAALMNPPQPNRALKNAFDRHKKLSSKHGRQHHTAS